MPPDVGAGWRYHVADFQIIIMTKGRARFMYEDNELSDSYSHLP